MPSFVRFNPDQVGQIAATHPYLADFVTYLVPVFSMT